jgi:hypothetical protein
VLAVISCDLEAQQRQMSRESKKHKKATRHDVEVVSRKIKKKEWCRAKSTEDYTKMLTWEKTNGKKRERKKKLSNKETNKTQSDACSSGSVARCIGIFFCLLLLL